MKKSGFSIFLIILLVFSCKSPERLLQEGNYEEAINRSLKKIQKGNDKEEDRLILYEAFRYANNNDKGRIDFLLQENRPENWDEIYWKYISLDGRQNRINTVLPQYVKGRELVFNFEDYNARIIEAKTNAAEFFYNEGVSLMEVDTRESYRQAFYNLQKVREYRPSDYPDLDRRMDDALFLGTSRVLVIVENRIPVRLPADFFREVHSVNTAALNGNWAEYHLARLDKETHYDYYVTITLDRAYIEPPVTESREYIRTKEVQDGYRSKRDADGNVITDENGKVVKEARYKEIECKVYEIKQIKAATVSGEIHYVSTDPKSLIRKVPVAGTTVFEHVSGRAVGDRNALLPEDWEIIKREKANFPPDLDMLMDCAPILRDAATHAMQDNRNTIH